VKVAQSQPLGGKHLKMVEPEQKYRKRLVGDISSGQKNEDYGLTALIGLTASSVSNDSYKPWEVVDGQRGNDVEDRGIGGARGEPKRKLFPHERSAENGRGVG